MVNYMKKSLLIISKSRYFKLIFLCLLPLSLLALGAIDKKNNVILGIGNSLGYYLFLIFLELLFISNIIYLNRQLFNNSTYIIRFKSRREALDNSRYLGMIINTLLFIIIGILVTIIVFLRVNDKSVGSWTEVLILEVFIIRSLILLLLISDLINYLYLFRSKKLIYGYIFLIVWFFFFHDVISIKALDVFYYLEHYRLFDSLFLNIIYSLGIISVSYTINMIVRSISLRGSGE